MEIYILAVSFICAGFMIYMIYNSNYNKVPPRRKNNIRFSERILVSKGNKCKASWRVDSHGGMAYSIQCRECGTYVQSGCVPKCLLKQKASD